MKRWYKSRTVWLGIGMALAGAAELTPVVEFLPDEWQGTAHGAILFVCGIGGIILRFDTTKAIR